MAAKKKKTRVPKASKKDPYQQVPVEDYEHSEAKRTNNPPAGLAHLDRDETPTKTLAYDPHLDPQMVWAGKAERAAVEVPAPSVYVHEELSAQNIVGSVRKLRLQSSLFDVGDLDPAKAVEFYRHDMSWSNRMILGDSLVVMTSLLERERLGGKVQTLYIDPPYGIRYNSNFQPRIGNTRVADGLDSDLTREPEMIQAYRDTWELEVHSYLTYLRDRLTVARELLSESGSVFVQIGDENVHRVRLLMDEVFGSENHMMQIVVRTAAGQTSGTLAGVTDYILWYARSRQHVKYRELYRERTEQERGNLYSAVDADGVAFGYASMVSASPSQTTVFPVELDGKTYLPAKGRGWRTNEEGMQKLKLLGRLHGSGKTLSFVRKETDFPLTPLTSLWTDTMESTFAVQKRYVVQTAAKVITRCLLLTSDPGDLVLDPTCGSGTTAYAAELMGRRWITGDTSRVAISIARERLLTSTFPYFALLDESRGVDGGFDYETVDRTNLRSLIHNNEGEKTSLVDRPKVVAKKVRVSGPFTVEALSRYATNPSDAAIPEHRAEENVASHVEILLNALRSQGIPRPGSKPAKIENMVPLSGAGALQAEGVLDRDGKKIRFAVSLGPRFGAITMAQVSDSLQDAIGFGLVVFAGFAVSADAQSQLATGKVGGSDVALLLANPDLLVGDLLKNTSSSQTFRLYASPDVRISRDEGGWRATVEGVDSFDASTGEVTSFGRSGIQAWFLDDAYDGKVFRVSQAFFPVTNGWEKLERALRGTIDAELVEELHSWTSLPFETPESGRIAVRVISDDGNASEVVLSVVGAAGSNKK